MSEDKLKNVRKMIDKNRLTFSEVVNLKEAFSPKVFRYLYVCLQSEFEILRELEELLLNGK